MAGKQVIATVLLAVTLTSGCGNAASTPPITPSPPATTLPVSEPSPTPLPPLAFDTLGMNSYEDPVGSLRFLLEVRNTNNFDVQGVKATVFLQDGEGKIVDSQSGYARLDVLRAGETAPVMIVFFLGAPEFSTYEVEIEGREADYLAGLLYRYLQVVEQTGRVGEWVPYEVLGQVDNTGGRDAESVTMIVTCYDLDGKVVAVSTGRPTERRIRAGGSSDFLISIGALAGEIANCKVQVQGLIANHSDWF